MQKLRDLLGLPVLITETGTQIGEVKEAILDLEQAALRGIVLTGANWFMTNQGVVFTDVYRIGRDALMLRATYAIQELTPAKLPGTLCYLSNVLDKQLYTDTGLHLGILADALYDCITGEIKAYEVSDGLIADLLYGRKIMPMPQTQVVEQDRLIIPDSMTKLLMPGSNEV